MGCHVTELTGRYAVCMDGLTGQEIALGTGLSDRVQKIMHDPTGGKTEIGAPRSKHLGSCSQALRASTENTKKKYA